LKTQSVPLTKESSTPAKETAKTDYLKSARDIAFVMAIFLYFAGWIYICFYLDGFGIPIKAVDFDIYNLLIFSSNVFIYFYNVGKWYLLISILLIIGLMYWERALIIARKLIPLIVVLLFPFIFYIARQAAQYDADNAKLLPAKYLKGIEFTFKDVKNDSDIVLKSQTDSLIAKNVAKTFFMIKQNMKGNFRLVSLNKDEYFVLQAGIKLTKDDLKSYVPIIFIIKKEMVQFVKITK
jgi:hypothetical protein